MKNLLKKNMSIETFWIYIFLNQYIEFLQEVSIYEMMYLSVLRQEPKQGAEKVLRCWELL